MNEEELYDDWDEEDDKEPEVVEVFGELRLDPEAAKRYLEIRKAREMNHEPKGLSDD